MRIGIFDHLDDSGLPLAEHYEARLRLAERYDAAGFHAYHLAEHHATPLGTAPSPNVFLAALAQRTRRLRFGPMVYCLPLYHPVRLYEEICMLDQMSRGRLEFGVGRGISPIELGFFGIETAVSREMYAEALELIRRALAGGRLSFVGEHYRVEDMPLELAPVQRPHPPLWYGVADPASATRAAAQSMHVITNRPLAEVRGIADAYRARWQTLDRDEAELPYLGVSRHLVLSDDGEEALAIAGRAYRRWRAGFLKLWNEHGMAPVNVRLPPEIDQMIEAGLAVVGTPESVADTLRAQIESTGITYLAARFAFGDLDFDQAARSVDLFVERVWPRLS